MSRVSVPFCLVLGIVVCTLAARGSNTHLDDPYTLVYVPLVPTKVGKMVHDTLPPLKDRTSDFINTEKTNPFDLKDPKAVEQSVEYDPATNRYIIQEKIGGEDFRPPTYMTFDEYMEYRRQQDQSNYFKELSGINVGDGVSALDPIAKIDVKNSLLDRLFGGTKVDIRPQGGIDLTFGFNYQKVENPILPIRSQRQGGFDFDMDIQLNVTGKIGEKLNLSTQFNSNATFSFDNQIKLNYNSDNFGEDEILKKIEAGNVSLPLRGTLIQGAQSLFGLKTELQFGHLRLTTILAQQQSQRENIRVQGGSQLQEFEVRADEYDENRHFFVSHYNRAIFEGALTNLPQIKSLFKVENIEVWLTNNRNEVDDVRDIIAFADLGESSNLVNPDAVQLTTSPDRFDINSPALPLPDNRANDLYNRLLANENTRKIDNAVGTLQSGSFNLQQSKDFEKVSARRLEPTEYNYNAELGFVSLNINVQPDQVVGVAYQYSYNGRTYKVGELAQNQEVTGLTNSDPFDPKPRQNQDTSDLKVLFVKMLKSTTQRTDLPTWDLMMKNIYSVGAFNVNQQDFRLDIVYDDPGRGFKRFLPDVPIGGNIGVPLLRVFNLDTLNTQNDPQPDGVFDFVPGVTINLRNGRVMFPVLEPFGSSLAKKLDNPADSIKFTYQALYDSTIFQAREFPEKNRFVIRGNYKSSVSSEISLGAFNIPVGSVRVTAGGQQLIEGSDYEIDYNIGRVRILNDALLSSGAPINVSFEDNALFGFQSKTMIGLRADYELDENFIIGATYLNLFERPFTQKVNIGEDPINNRMYGFDVNLSRNAPWLTKIVDALPFFDTKQESKITISAEAAAIQPGHSRAINQNKKDKGGVVYLDDFEGSASSFDLRNPVNQWFLASTPQYAVDPDNGRKRIFRESELINDLRYGANRAKLNWYLVDSQVRSAADENNPYTSLVPQQEIFPFQQLTQLDNFGIQTMNMTFYPSERGPYNFDFPNGYEGYTTGLRFLNDSLELKNPETRWGGIMKALQTTDFQASNIEFLEFWMLSPFLDEQNANAPLANPEQREGSLYINLGNVSEDILRDSRKFFENGLPAPDNPDRKVDQTTWSVVPITQQITRAFDIQPAARVMQDVGLDGLNDTAEVNQFRPYLDAITSANPRVALKLKNDLSNDNFRYFRDQSFPTGSGVMARYRDFNNPEGNSQENSGTELVTSGTNIPDAEDLNRDNTLSETEAYFQYKIPFYADPTNPRRIDVNRTPYITDVRDTISNGRIWYRFRIPLDNDQKIAVNGIRDFRSIRFMRMYMTDFTTPTTLRFATMELVRNQWRRYMQDLSEVTTGLDNCDPEETSFDVDAVNIEENSGRTPFNYVLPEDIQRETSLGVFNALQNEQSLSMIIKGLCKDDSRAVFKTLNMDMRVYDRLKMFVHAEARDGLPVNNDGLSVFIRLGSDIKENYYEYEIPLTMSDSFNLATNRFSSAYKNEVWRPENEFDISLKKLVAIKEARNDDRTFSLTDDFIRLDTVQIQLNDSTFLSRVGRVKVRGNPNLGYVKIAMIGVRNKGTDYYDKYSTEVWVNEMRLTGLDERGGMAAIARIDMQLADLGSLTLAANYSTIGFGAIDQKVQQRSREEIVGYDFAASLELSKFFPQSWGLRLPFFAQISNQTRTPEYDPYDFDVKVKDKYRNGDALVIDADGDSTILRRRDVQDVTNIRSYNFTNIRKERVGENTGKPMPWDIENFSFSYAFTETHRRDPIVEFDRRRRQTGGLDYSYSRNVTYLEPFKWIKSDKFLNLFKQINFNLFPNSFSFSTLLDRRFDQTRYRFTGYDTEEQIAKYATFYNKRFTWDRDYNLQWDLTRSLKISFDALANSVIDEPNETFLLESNIGDVDKFRRDSIWTNIKKLGRPKNYQHNLNVSYQLPIRYLPYLDWVQVRANYQAEYGWVAGALNVVDELGNVIRNSQNRQLSADLNFTSLYSKFNYLRNIERPQNPAQGNRPQTTPQRNNNQQPPRDSTSRRRPKADDGPGGLERALIRPLLLLRTARLNYTERFATVVPGFTPEANLLGMGTGFEGPDWGFVAGLQPEIRNLTASQYGTSKDWLYKNRRWINPSISLNQQVIQEYSQNWSGQLTVEPVRDFRIDLDINKVYQETHSEYFKRRSDTSDFAHLIPQDFGSMTISYLAVNTMFDDSRARITKLFQTFEDNRVIISKRIGTGLHDTLALAELQYTNGYGRTQQDVLIPAFIAAYTDQSASSIGIDIFKTLPRPNWRVTYNGLSKLPFFRDVFQNFSLTHSYKATLTVNRFNTGLDRLREEQETEDLKNELNGNFYPRLEIPEVAIQEGFAPLLAVNATLKNGMSFNFDYKRSRILAMSFVSNQLSETRVKEITLGFGYIIRNLDIAFLTGSNKNKRTRRTPEQQQTPTNPQGNRGGGSGNGQLQNRDLDIQFNFSLRDDVTFNHLLDQDVIEPTRGNFALNFSPSAEYKLNKRLSLRAFVDYRRAVPKTSAGFPRTDVAGGIVVRFQLN